MDIPDSVTMAGGAAAMATERLGRSRGALVSEKIYPEERDIRGGTPAGRGLCMSLRHQHH